MADPLLKEGRNGLASDQVFIRFALTDHMDFPAFDERFRNPGARIVIRRHNEPVGACAHHSQEFARFNGG
jgi:hypothetical protein